MRRIAPLLVVAAVLGLVVWRVPPHGIAIANETSRPLVVNEVTFDGQTRRPAVSLMPGERVSMRFRKHDPLPSTTFVILPARASTRGKRRCKFAGNERGKPRKRPGRKPSARRGVPHTRRPKHARWEPIHITLRAVHGLPSFRQQVLYLAFLASFRTTRRVDFRIVEFSPSSSLSRFWSA